MEHLCRCIEHAGCSAHSLASFLLRFMIAASAVLPGVGLRVMGVLMIRGSTEGCGLPGH
jgi:hypothetical protein